jgi:Protein of unknown function (DUF2442)
MTSSTLEVSTPAAHSVVVTDDALSVELADGRSLSAPLVWFPRLLHASPTERSHWRLTGGGEGLRWDDLDEDISIESLLSGRASQESAVSLDKWLRRRNKRT